MNNNLTAFSHPPSVHAAGHAAVRRDLLPRADPLPDADSGRALIVRGDTQRPARPPSEGVTVNGFDDIADELSADEQMAAP